MTFTDWRADQKAPSAIRPYILLDSAHGFQWNARDDTDSNNNGYICKKTLEFSIKVDGLLFKLGVLIIMLYSCFIIRAM